jgi:lysophospholipase L1-like esterase
MAEDNRHSYLFLFLLLISFAFSTLKCSGGSGAPPPVLEQIAIEGPLSVPENSSTDYKTRAFFTDGSSQVVDPDGWNVDCQFAAISPEGVLTSTEVTTDELCRISASYSEGGAEQTGALDISISDQVIIDNNDPGATPTGLWAVSFAPNPFDADSVESTDPGGTFGFLAPARKFYELSLWWTVTAGRCSDAEVQIYDSVNSIDYVVDLLNVDQTANGGQWNRLGTYVFNGTAKVVLGSQGGCSTSADAVMFNSEPGVYFVAVGDSITEGIGDNDLTDGFGFPAILETLLNTTEVNHKIANEGVGGHTSAQGLTVLPTILARHPESHGFLVLYGTNDAGLDEQIPPVIFKGNMQQIIGRIEADGKEAYLAKLPIILGNQTTPFLSYPDPENPPAGSRGDFIIEYNIVIDELVFENSLPIPPPDFWTYFSEIDPDNPTFKRYETQYADNLHPNEEGYRSMASLWFEALTQ